MKKRIFDIIQIGNKEDIPSVIFDLFLVAVICSNITCMFLETFEQFSDCTPVFQTVEVITVGIFCAEYILRIWTADYLYPEKRRARAIGKFLCSFDGIVELLTILPFFFLSGFIVFRMLRVVRIFHLFRLNTQYDSFNVITSVLCEKRNQIISSIFIVFVLMLASSLCMYSAEHDAQPQNFRNAFSGVWWAVSTLLTVGYGDIYPVTVLGKVMGICIAFLGVGVVAIPTGIISAGFVEMYQKDMHAEEEPVDIASIGELLVDETSPYCGRTIRELADEFEIRAYMVLRGELKVIAAGDLKVQEGDILIVQANRLKKSDTAV